MKINSANASASRSFARSGSTSWLGLSRSELVACMFVVGVANALIPNIVNGIAVDGLVYSILNTFEISAIVWLAIFLAIKYALASSVQQITGLDRLVTLVMLIGCLLPIGPAMWVLLAAFAVYLILTAKRGEMFHRSGWIIVAITVPMFWSKRLFNIFSDFFLSIDAELVSSITGTQRVSNLVPIPNSSGYLQIAAPCSSMANVSLAILCWIIFTQATGLRWRPRNVLWCGVACLSVISINVTRISLIGFYPDQYELLHGPVGATVVSWVTIFVVLTICHYGVGRGRLKLI